MHVKRMLHNYIRLGPVNGFVKTILKPIAPHIPVSLLEKIPAVGSVSVNLPTGKTLFLETDGRDSNTSLLYWLGIEGFEGATLEVFLKLLKYTKTFVDIGASTGIFCCIAGVDDSTRKIYAFEPLPDAFDRLRINISANKLEHVSPFQLAMSNSEGEATFYISNTLRLALGASMNDLYANGTQIKVSTTTLDSFVAQNKTGPIDLIKMDTETTEPAVLEGARGVLERDQPIIICEVLHGKTESALHALLDTKNYDYYLIAPNGLQKKSRIVGDDMHGNNNYLFMPKSKAEKILPQLV